MTGLLDVPRTEAGGHLCWLFRGDDAFRQAAVTYLGAGLERGERLVYVADRSPEAMADDLAPLGDVDALGAAGRLVLAPASGIYDHDGGFDRQGQVERYRAMTLAALADGHRGLCLAADATSLVRTPVDRAAFVPYELAVDRVMAELPMTAMCAYDQSLLGSAATELCAVHPLQNAVGRDAAGFCVFHDGDRLRLRGELDLANAHLLDTALAAVEQLDGTVISLDLADLEFADADALVRLDALATTMAGRGRQLRFLHVTDIVRRCCTILGLDALLDDPDLHTQPA